MRFFCDCFCFQLEVHVRDKCPATKIQCEYKNLGCEAVVWTFLYIYMFKIIFGWKFRVNTVIYDATDVIALYLIFFECGLGRYLSRSVRPEEPKWKKNLSLKRDDEHIWPVFTWEFPQPVPHGQALALSQLLHKKYVSPLQIRKWVSESKKLINTFLENFHLTKSLKQMIGL